MLFVDLVGPWAAFGAEDVLFDTLVDVTGISAMTKTRAARPSKEATEAKVREGFRRVDN